MAYKHFQTLINQLEAVELPAEAITPEGIKNCSTPISEGHNEKFGVPSLEELGIFLCLIFLCMYVWVLQSVCPKVVYCLYCFFKGLRWRA